VVLTHKPTGQQVRSEEGRHRGHNEHLAWERLEAKLRDAAEGRDADRVSAELAQGGLGKRGQKIRTYRVRDDLVIDHRTDRRCRFQDYARGKFRFSL
jgi:peptide chain release factor 1